MERLHQAIKNVHRLDDLAARDTPLTRLHPLAKLLAVLVYLAVTLSFGRYALTGLLGMGLYPLVLYELDDLSLRGTLRQFKPVALLLAAVGVFNLFFDRAPVLTLGGWSVTGGWVSLATLLLKGLFSFLAVYLLIATTGMEAVCAALQQLHLPRVLVTTILLIYRYIVLLLPTPCARLGRRASISARGARCWGSCFCAASTARSSSTRACSCGVFRARFTTAPGGAARRRGRCFWLRRSSTASFSAPCRCLSWSAACCEGRGDCERNFEDGAALLPL